MNKEYINYNEIEDMEYLCKLLEQRDEDIKTFKFTIKTQQQMIDELINKIDKVKEYCERERGNIIKYFEYLDTKDLDNILKIIRDED